MFSLKMAVRAGAILLCALTTQSYAASITAPITLFNTGVDAAGNALIGGNGIVDPHYSIFSSDIAGVTTGVSAVTYFNGAYAPDSATSRWISHSATGFPGGGTTTFRTTFDLTGLNPSSAVITGMNAADNAGTILLNGTSVGSLNGSFNTLVPFTISTGFINGLNTLDFAVTDFGPPLALRIADISGTANNAGPTPVPEPVPEPVSIALLGLGLAGIAAVRRKRKHS